MSNNKKKKRKLSPSEQAHRAQMKEEALLGLRTLINNDACIKTSREWKGFKGHGIPVLIAIVSVLIALVPSLVTRLNVNAGGSFIASPNYSYNVGLQGFTESMYAESCHVKIVDGAIVTEGNLENVLTAKQEGSASKSTWYQEVTTSTTGTKKITFEAFVNTDPALSDDDFFANIAGDGTLCKTPDGYNRDVLLTWNYLAIGKNSILFTEYNTSTGKAYSAVKGSYDRLNGYDLINDNMPEAGVTGLAAQSAIADKWANVISLSYETTKISSTFQFVGVLGAVYLGLIGLFGLLIFLMTRGKNNPMRIFSLWDTQKMAYWASFSPAVLSLAIGFMMSTSAIGIFAFIFLFGMRLMWMSMKSLRPAQ